MQSSLGELVWKAVIQGDKAELLELLKRANKEHLQFEFRPVSFSIQTHVLCVMRFADFIYLRGAFGFPLRPTPSFCIEKSKLCDQRRGESEKSDRNTTPMHSLLMGYYFASMEDWVFGVEVCVEQPLVA